MMTNIEKVSKNWEARQQALLKHPAKRELHWKVRNDKRSERFDGTWETRQLTKYGIPREYYYAHEWEDYVA